MWKGRTERAVVLKCDEAGRAVGQGARGAHSAGAMVGGVTRGGRVSCAPSLCPSPQHTSRELRAGKAAVGPGEGEGAAHFCCC